ncbi:MAG: hypothetical protein PHP85_07075 [Gallionella sp.]|nr:hypothetical protein [Gallionella sp.]
MKKSHLLMLLAVLYAGQAMAVDAAVAPGAKKAVPTAKPKVHRHKKPCVEKEGKPCHLSQHADASSVKRAEPEEQAKAPPDIMKAAGPAALAAPVAAKPEVKSEAAKPELKSEAAKPEVKSEAAVPAVDALALAKKKNCLVCHAVDKKVVGPAWRDVAAKYRGDAGALPRLMAKIARGGSGVWGSMAMPPQPQVSEADRATLARFVLDLQ